MRWEGEEVRTWKIGDVSVPTVAIGGTDLDHFSVEAEEHMEDVHEPTGQKVQVVNRRTATVARPNRLITLVDSWACSAFRIGNDSC
jgi:hypothetical protein